MPRKKNVVKHIVETLTVIALFFTFYFGFSKGYAFHFFVTLSYFYLLELEPKSMKEVIIKSICYPMIFLILFAIFSKHPYYDFIQKMSSNLLFYIMSIIIIYFSLRDKIKNNREFSLKHPLFWLFAYTIINSIVLQIT